MSKNETKNRAIIIQARTGSTRLPRKMLLPLNGETVLEFLLNRLQHVPFIDQLIVATTVQTDDDDIETIGERLQVPVFRGATQDVLDRFYQTVQRFHVDVIVRICGDNIFMETSEITRLLRLQADGHYDYLVNTLLDKTPLILTGTGLAVEVFTRQALEKLMAQNLDDYHKEHVTPFFYEHPELFQIAFSPVPFEIFNDMRLTLDTKEDFEHIKKIHHALHPNLRYRDIMLYLKNDTDMLAKMQAITRQQKKGR